LEPYSKTVFEEVMSAKQNNTWAFHHPDSPPCSLCCGPQTLQPLKPNVVCFAIVWFIFSIWLVDYFFSLFFHFSVCF